MHCQPMLNMLANAGRPADGNTLLPNPTFPDVPAWDGGATFDSGPLTSPVGAGLVASDCWAVARVHTIPAPTVAGRGGVLPERRPLPRVAD
jgi:hypothetical protein